MTGFRVVRHPEAFQGSLGSKKRPRVIDNGHLEWVRTLPCLITGLMPVEAAHIRYAAPAYGKGEAGMQKKPDDRWAVPLSPAMHREQHDTNEVVFWAKHGIDPLQVALALFNCGRDHEMARIIIRSARERAKEQRA